ncbi:hypothetical protein EDB83DRAFT_2517174 [Lactarius deliciosus]|nr:hypothetical protein EDB83DRAFT_2517174 [Lactarius deliciosus]
MRHTSKSDATDIVNFDEYEGLVTKIIKRRPTKAIIGFVNMRAVEKAFSKKSRNRPFLGSEDEDGDGLGGDQGDNTDADENSMGLSKINYELKKHATDHNGTYAYIDPTTAAMVPLTPYMIKEWAWAMYDGLATVTDPPQTVTFDLENRKSSLGSRNRAISSASTISGGPSTEISALSAVSDLFSSITTFMCPGHAVPTTPKPSNKLTSCALNTAAASPPAIFNTPSKLERFLQAVESNGIPGVQSYHSSLLLKGYGPDIMHLITVPDLVEVGVSPGDAIRLREYASKWWAQERQRVAKCSLLDIAQVHAPLQTGSSSLAPNGMPPNKWLHFEKRFYDGGGMTSYGCGIAKGTHDTDDYTWWVYSRELKEYVPLPPGKVPVFNDPGPPELLVDGEGCDGLSRVQAVSSHSTLPTLVFASLFISHWAAINMLSELSQHMQLLVLALVSTFKVKFVTFWSPLHSPRPSRQNTTTPTILPVVQKTLSAHNTLSVTVVGHPLGVVLMLITLSTTFGLGNPLNAMQILLVMSTEPIAGIDPVDHDVPLRPLPLTSSASIIVVGTLFVYYFALSDDQCMLWHDQTMTSYRRSRTAGLAAPDAELDAHRHHGGLILVADWAYMHTLHASNLPD